MTERKSTMALIQMRCGPEPEKNFTRATEFIREAAANGAQIVCLPELFQSQYFCQAEDHKNFDLAEEVPGKSTAALGDVARKTGAVIIASRSEEHTCELQSHHDLVCCLLLGIKNRSRMNARLSFCGRGSFFN